jgi:hypothetical protein
MCLSSFIYYGHEVTLYVYDPSIEAPEGVTVKDANEIVDESAIFLASNSYAPFSDMFRYQMIQKTGLVWTDADNVCLSGDWNFENGVVVGYENYDGELILNNSIFGLPQDSEPLLYIIERSTSFDKTEITWAEIGSKIIEEAFKKFDYFQHVQEPHVFCPIGFRKWHSYWTPAKYSWVMEQTKASKSVSLFNQMSKWSSMDRNTFIKGSFLDTCYDKFVTRLGPNE